MPSRPQFKKDGTCAHADYLQEGTIFWCKRCGSLKINGPLDMKVRTSSEAIRYNSGSNGAHWMKPNLGD